MGNGLGYGNVASGRLFRPGKVSRRNRVPGPSLTRGKLIQTKVRDFFFWKDGSHLPLAFLCIDLFVPVKGKFKNKEKG